MTAEFPERSCIDCGYNLHGITSARCPECGRTIDWESGSPIPWQHRAGLGRFRAFWRTLILASLRPRTLAGAAGVAVDEQAARRFRWIVIALATIPAIAWYVTIICLHGVVAFEIIPLYTSGQTNSALLLDPGWQFAVLWTAGSTLLSVLPIGFAVTLLVGTGLSRRFFHPSATAGVRQHRGAILSNYLSAPLAWLFVPAVSTLVLFHVPGLFSYSFADVFLLAALCMMCAVLPVIVWLCWWNVMRASAFVTDSGPGHWVSGSIFMAIHWFTATTTGLVIFPMIVGFVWLVIDSLR